MKISMCYKWPWFLFVMLIVFSCKDPEWYHDNDGMVIDPTLVNPSDVSIVKCPPHQFGFDCRDSVVAYLSIKAADVGAFTVKIPWDALYMSWLKSDNNSIAVVDTSDTLVGTGETYISIISKQSGSTDINIFGCTGENSSSCNILLNSVHVKVYEQRVMPSVKMYRCYNTTSGVRSFNYIKKVLKQAVCVLGDSAVIPKPSVDKSWDKNGNGRLDIWPEDPTNTGNEFEAVVLWVYNQGWVDRQDTNSAIVILEQNFEVHDANYMVFGVTGNNVSILGLDAFDKEVAHEYLHQQITGDLHDIETDDHKDNIMYFEARLGTDWNLQYTDIDVLIDGNFTTERQWDLLSKQVY